MKRCALKRRTPLRRTGRLQSRVGLARRTPIKKAGKKTKAWDGMRRKLKTAFARAGITVCEAQVNSECWGDNLLGFAHTLKRRNITTPQQLAEVILACNNCHDILEGLGESAMQDSIREIISQRKVPVVVDLSGIA